jgi:hypothetical protein
MLRLVLGTIESIRFALKVALDSRMHFSMQWNCPKIARAWVTESESPVPNP